MKLRKLFATAAAVAITGGLAAAAPSSASDSSETTVTFTVTSGTLNFSAEDASHALTFSNDVTGMKASAKLDAFTVSDTRNADSGWVVSASSTAMTQQTDSLGNAVTAGDTIANSFVHIQIGATDYDATSLLSGQVFTPDLDGTTGADGGAIGTLTLTLADLVGSSNNEVTYNPTVTVTIPAGVAGGGYQGTVTQTVV